MSKQKARRRTPWPPDLNDSINEIQVIGNPAAFLSGAEPTVREMTLDDLDDDCPVCVANRERILAGDPPIVMAFD